MSQAPWEKEKTSTSLLSRDVKSGLQSFKERLYLHMHEANPYAGLTPRQIKLVAQSKEALDGQPRGVSSWGNLDSYAIWVEKAAWGCQYERPPVDETMEHLKRLHRLQQNWSRSQLAQGKLRAKISKAIQLVDNPVLLSQEGYGNVIVTEDTRDGIRVRDLFSATIVLSKLKQITVTFDLRQKLSSKQLVGDLPVWEYEFSELLRDSSVGRFQKVLMLNDKQLPRNEQMKCMSLFDIRERGLKLVLLLMWSRGHSRHRAEDKTVSSFEGRPPVDKM